MSAAASAVVLRSETSAPTVPPSARYTRPVVSNVMTRHAVLKATRYGGLRSIVRNIDCENAPTAATTRLGSMPNSSSAMKSNTNDTDIVAWLLGTGNRSLNVDVTMRARTMLTNSGRRPGGGGANNATST